MKKKNEISFRALVISLYFTCELSLYIYVCEPNIFFVNDLIFTKQKKAHSRTHTQLKIGLSHFTSQHNFSVIVHVFPTAGF